MSIVAAREPLPPAGFWIRGVAVVVDVVVLALVEISLRYVASRLGGDDFRDPENGGLTAPVRALADVFTLLFALLYTTVLHATAGQTIGKMILGIRVVDVDGTLLAPGASLLRSFAYGASALPVGLGFVMAGLRRDKRALHDLLAGSRVERVRSRRRTPTVAPTVAAAAPPE